MNKISDRNLVFFSDFSLFEAYPEVKNLFNIQEAELASLFEIYLAR